MNRRQSSQKGGDCGTYNDPALDYRHCGGSKKNNRRRQSGGEFEIPSDVTYTYLSDKTSELATHWANPAFPARGGARNQKRQIKQKGGELDYPFESQYNEYPIPNKMNFAIDEGVSTNFVSNKDLYGCQQKGGSKKLVKNQKGGDCGCNQPISLGGALKKNQKKQKGAGYGYNVDVAHAITNRPEIVRYSTEGTGYYGANQKGGSAASDSLMEYFLDFQHRCRNSEIY